MEIQPGMRNSVLIVEDTDHVREGLRIALESQDYKVACAEDGRQGINMFRQVKPDIVLLDIRMPRLSGIDVCTLIRNESDVPVIMFSGIDERADVLLALQRGATDYVLKDTGYRELLNRVEKHLIRLSADAASAADTAEPSRPRLLPFKRKVAMAKAAITAVKESALPGAARKTEEPVPVDEFTPARVVDSSPPKKPADLTGLRVQTVRIEPEKPDHHTAGESLEDLIIVVHSDAESLEMLARIARNTNYEVISATTGQQAIESLKLKNPKLVIMGNTLSDMGCFSVVEAIASHSMGEMIGMVIATSKRSPELARKARYMGVHQTVLSPWNDGRLDVAIRSALASTRRARTRIAA